MKEGGTYHFRSWIAGHISLMLGHSGEVAIHLTALDDSVCGTVGTQNWIYDLGFDVKKGYDWADPNGKGRPCCHVCSGNLNERRKARDRARAMERQGQPEVVVEVRVSGMNDQQLSLLCLWPPPPPALPPRHRG